MYFPYFIAYMTFGLLIGLLLFFWALKNGQFQEQQRARFLPLQGEDGEIPSPRASRWGRFETYALFFLAGAGLLCSAAVLVVALVTAP
jgi:cbb3-type cytochrome oxidase maturation protein